ncbi:hypothetical protein BDN71DRAFT_1438166, partial [Pleurotus eryngii]
WGWAVFGVVPEASTDGGHGSGWSSCDEHRGIALARETLGSFQSFQDSEGVNTRLSSLKKEHTLAGDLQEWL